MLSEMTDRGPDSAGFAIYRDGVEGEAKVSVYDAAGAEDWPATASAIEGAIGVPVTVERASTHVILRAKTDPATLRGWLETHRPGLRIMSSGASLEIYKEIGLPADVLEPPSHRWRATT